MGGTEQVKEGAPRILSRDILVAINVHIEDLEQLLAITLVSEPDQRESEADVASAHSALLTELNRIESRLLSLKSRIDL